MSRVNLAVWIIVALRTLTGSAGEIQARDVNPPAKVFDPAGMGLLRTIVPGGDPDALAF